MWKDIYEDDNNAYLGKGQVGENDHKEINLHVLLSFCARMHAQSLSYVRLFVTLWTICDPMEPPPGFSVLDPGSSRQEYWSELLFSFPGDPPDLGV